MTPKGANRPPKKQTLHIHKEIVKVIDKRKRQNYVSIRVTAISKITGTFPFFSLKSNRRKAAEHNFPVSWKTF